MHTLVLGQYKNLNLVEPTGFNAEDLERTAIESILNNSAIWCKHNLPIAEGDRITIKIESKENGILVPEFCQSKLQYTVGDRNYLKDFSNSIGKKCGENFKMEINFDETCVVERIRNKKVDFYATITDVTHNKIPDITDEFIHKFDPECHTVEQLKEKYASILTSRALADMDEQKKTLS